MELRLVYKDGDYTEDVDVTTSRFAIGRSPDNEFVIDDSNLSRRHALIENFDGVYFVSDCGSQNGTTLNGKAVSGPVKIHDGDIILLGDDHEFRVKLGSQATATSSETSTKAKSVSIKSGASSHRNQGATVSQRATGGLSVQTIQILIGVIAVSLVLIIGAVAIALFATRGGRDNINNRPPINENENGNNGNIAENTPQPNNSPSINQPNENSTPQPTPDPKLSNLEEAAKKFLLKLNTHDTRPYAFEEKNLAEISRVVEQYRGSSQVADAIKRLQSSSASLKAQAETQGMQPGLLIYTALAASDGGKQGDPVAKAQAIFETLDFIRITLGEDDVDASLIVVAALPEGKGDKKGHPMTNRLTRLKKKNTLANRNIWYLRENNAVKDEGYQLALKLLALGAISQNPQLFGVNASPLNF